MEFIYIIRYKLFSIFEKTLYNIMIYKILIKSIINQILKILKISINIHTHTYKDNERISLI
jgi:hypothetical protein